jgi:CDP-diglyceride synthetase
MVIVIKVSNIIKRQTDNRKLLLISILLLSHSFIFFRFYFYQYMVEFLFNTVIYVFLLLGLCILIVRLPWLRFFRAFSSVARKMPGYNSPSRGTARTLPKFFCSQNLCCSMYCLFCVVLCTLCAYMCTVQLPPGCDPIAVKKYINHILQAILILYLFSLFNCILPHALHIGNTQRQTLTVYEPAIHYRGSRQITFYVTLCIFLQSIH